MIPGLKNIMLRYTFIVVIMLVLAILIIVKAGFIMFAERQYWKDVADRFVKENVIVPPTRGNIISSDGKLMASSLPEYRIYMDFRLDGRTHRKDNQAQPARHGRDADHNGRVSEHGARCVLRPEAPFSNTVQESG
jgi:cell division protein FtsI/penicillin-binding protein 2